MGLEFLIPGIFELILFILVAIIFLLVVWAIISIPVYISAKFVSGKRATFGSAMAAVLFGIIVSSIIYYVVYFFVYAATGERLSLLPNIAAFLGLVAVYKSEFRTGWTGAFIIAILSAIIWTILSLAASYYLGHSYSLPFNPRLRFF
jgi:uncharacterized BrkB/YihY/UPF0761 family membrane protein